MKTFLIFCGVLFNICNSSAQKIEPEKEDFFVDTIKLKIYIVIIIDDYKFIDMSSGKKIIINDLGQYQYKDSVLADGDYHISLYKNFDSDIGPTPYGNLEGNIIDGRKEGLWTKQIYCKDTTVVVKIMNYSNGLLDGNYIIFNTEGDTLHYKIPHPFDDNKKYNVFKQGTGVYYDYYYDIGILKEKGFLLKGKKDGDWIIYDRQGNEIKRDIYRNGVLVSD